MAGRTLSDTIDKNEPYIISELFSGWEQDGYTFSGWNTQENGRGTSYSPLQVVSSGFSSNVDLYAQWTKNSIPHKLTVIVTSFPNGQGINVTVGDNDAVYISNKQEFPSVLAGTRIVLGTSDDYDQYNITDDSGNNWDISEEQYYGLDMPDGDYTLNIFVSSSIGTNFQCKDTSGEYMFQGILQGIDEGYSYKVEVPICMIGHYGLNTDHDLKCRLGYNSSDGTTHYFYNDSNGNTQEHTEENEHITVVTKLRGRGFSDDYPKDGPDGTLGYWMGSQTETGEWKSDDYIKSRNGLLGYWFVGADPSFWHYSISNNNPGGTPCSFYMADDRDGDPHRCISGPNLNGETFIIHPSGTGTCTLGIQVKDAATNSQDCAGIGAFIKLKVTRLEKMS